MTEPTAHGSAPSHAPARQDAPAQVGGVVPTRFTHRQIMVILSGLMTGMLLAALDQTIVSTALPTIVGDLGGLQHLSWVVTAYLLASTASSPMYGKISDLYGRKPVFRFAIIGDVIPPRERGRYQGYFGAVFAIWPFPAVSGSPSGSRCSGRSCSCPSICRSSGVSRRRSRAWNFCRSTLAGDTPYWRTALFMLTRGWASAWSCRPSSWRCRTPSALKGVDPSQLTGSPQVIAAPPTAVREPVVSSFVSVLSTVFVSAVPIVLLAFVLTWFLKENTLRGHDDTGAEPVEPAGSI